ncbi:MAG TPA: protease pro-enzyme activation domain-containing protein [Candidatus Baltobacteraceae bacterium]|nr:protease pro-enzyme activation domain-containing protein [Candidatus Baltobacteraceae bacterium]
MIRTFQLAARAGAGLVALSMLAACGGGGGGTTPRAVPQVNQPANGGGPTTSAAVRTLYPGKLFNSTTVTKLGPATAVNNLVLHVVVNMQNATGLAAYARAVNDPTNANYRKFLTASQIGAQFGATLADQTTVANYFASYGLKVGGWPQRLGLTVAGPRTAFEKALNTTFAYYRDTRGTMMVAPSTNVTFSKALPVSSIADAVMAPALRHTQLVHGTNHTEVGIGNTPQQIAAAFDYDGAYAAGYTGKGITIGIIGTGPFSSADFPTFRGLYGVAGSSKVNLAVVSASAAANTGGSPTATPPPVTPPCNGPSSNPNVNPSESPTASCNPEDGETQIDTQQSASLARDATVNYYLAYVPVECNTPGSNACSPDPNTGLGYAYQGLEESDDEIQQAIADNNGSASVRKGPDILSLSYGGPEVFQGYSSQANVYGQYDPTNLEAAEFAALAAEGVAVFVSSGDQGAQTCAPYETGAQAGNPCISYPADDPNVTSVGGVLVPLNDAGQYVGPITGWGEQTFSSTGQGGASGGGVSTLVPTPPWQYGPGVSTAGRNQPDASLEGDPNSGVAVVLYASLGGELADYGGTSVAAPEMAAMWALVLQACAQTSSCGTAGGTYGYRLGNAAPHFYKIYNDANAYPSSFYDVTFGNNGVVPCQQSGTCPKGSTPTPAPGYTAGTGYDHVTGIGVPFARHLIQAVVGV